MTLSIASDRPLWFHLHGYDKEAAPAPGSPVTLTFAATLMGRFSIEDEATGRRLGTLIIRPRGGR